jgi:hypothetical protein
MSSRENNEWENKSRLGVSFTTTHVQCPLAGKLLKVAPRARPHGRWQPPLNYLSGLGFGMLSSITPISPRISSARQPPFFLLCSRE